jgi:hypothetical protein
VTQTSQASNRGSVGLIDVTVGNPEVIAADVTGVTLREF